jgi:hypothetical protein
MLTLNILESPKRRVGLCPTCVYAVTQRGFEGEELTCCGYGGGLRELRFEVRECTAYIDRNFVPLRRVAGFVKPQTGNRKTIVIKIT